MSIFFISPAFAEPVDVEIDWTIEGQPKTTVNSSTEESIEDNYDIDVNTSKGHDQYLSNVEKGEHVHVHNLKTKRW